MNRLKLSKKQLRNLLLALACFVIVLFALPQWRGARANELAKQAEQTYAQDPAKAIEMLQTAFRIKSSPGIAHKLNEWQLVPQINEKPQGSEAVVLARRLVELRLLTSADQVLVNSGPLNSSGAALLAEIRLTLGKDLEDARSRLEAAVANDPADITLHELLKKVHSKLGNQKAASDEAAKIERLKAGKP